MTTTMTAAEHRAAAADCSRRAYESYQRSDTDGFMSQWAMDSSARRHLVWANLLEDGGTVETTALFLAETGEIASTHRVEGPYGFSWRLNDAATEAYGKRFFSGSKARKGQRRYDTDRAKGFTLGTIRVQGTVKGFGTTTIHYSAVADITALRQGDYTVLTADNGVGEDY